MKENKRTIILLGIIAFIALFSYKSYIKRNPIEKDIDQKKDFIEQVETIVAEKPKSKYNGNHLENGTSTFDVIYGKGIYSKTSNFLKVINNSSNDVVVILVRVKDEKVIRNEYIQPKSEFLMSKIPNSTCYTKFYYGNDWNPTRQAKGKLTGGFDNGEQFVISNEADDYLIFKQYTEGQYIHSSEYSIILETLVSEGNTLQEKNISPNEFF